MRKITLQMIADELCVSKGLVSKALSNAPDVNDLTKETIWRRAEELGYRIKNNKKISSDVKTGNIAVLMPEAYLNDMKYWGQVIQGIDKEIEKNKCSIILSSIDSSLPPNEGLPTSILESKVDGAIIVGQLPEMYLTALDDRNVPFVLLDSNFYTADYDHVLANNFRGALDATNLLLKSGHRRLAFVGDPETSLSFAERLRGFKTAIRRFNSGEIEKVSFITINGIGVSGEGMYITPVFMENIYQHLVKDRANSATGIFCANDLCALETLQRLKEWNMSCPEDVSVIGFDNLTITELTMPGLTTMNVSKEMIGSRAVELILRKIRSPDVLPEMLLISTKLIERGSVRQIGTTHIN